MKRIILFLVSMMTLLFFGTAQADTKTVYLGIGTAESGTTNDYNVFVSGNTTVANGTSSFVLWGAGLNRVQNKTILNSQELPSGYWIAEVSAVTPSQAQQGAKGNQSGVSYVIGFRQSTTGNHSKAEKRPIIINTIGSFTSPYQVPFFLDPSISTQFYAESGVTSLDGLNVKIFKPEGSAYSPPSPIVISEGVLTIPATGSGVSTLTVPDGTRYAEFSITGASMFYTADGLTTPSIAGNGTGILCNDLEGFSLTGNEARNAKFAKGGAARNVFFKYLTAKP